MENNEKGISMISLVVMIIVMLIIAGIIIYEGTSTLKSARQQSIYTNMLLIQAKARTIADKADFGEANYIGTEITDEETIKKLGIPEGSKAYKLSQENLNEIGVDVSGENKYAVDYQNDEVYYIDGIEDKNNNMHYSLSNMSQLSLDGEKSE